MTRAAPQVELLVCTKCRPGPEGPDSAECLGAALYRHLADADVAGVRVTPVECLSNCAHGCTVALRGPGRWTYVYGRLDPARDVETVCDGAARYAQTADGLVPWRARSAHFRKNCIARIPPLDTPVPSLGET